MIDLTKQYRTHDGKEVRIYAVDGVGNHCVHGAVLEMVGWVAGSWTINGDHNPSSYDPLELIEVKPRIKRTVWLNAYNDEYHRPLCLYFSREEADCGAGTSRIACVKIEVDCEEGEGL